MKLLQMTVDDFLSELASASPAPGGGSVAALAGALAAALAAMVTRLTIGREAYKDAWEGLEEACARVEGLGARLRQLVDEDSDAYNAVVAARKLPKSTPEEKEARTRALQEAVLRCTQVPLSTLESLAALADELETIAANGNPACSTDAGSAAVLIAAGAVAASWNVRVNIRSLADTPQGERLAARASDLLSRAAETSDRIERTVEARLSERSST
jgi:glutamate formiminotransferase/formiminotetrahydrofolate cyclodeaminase